MDEVGRLRDRIDSIDRDLVFLMKSRFENARQLGRIKRIRGITLRDFERERTILKRMRKLSEQLQIDSKLVSQVFRDIFRLSVAGQSSLATRPPPRLSGLSLLIVGGTGRMGRLFANFAAIQGARVRIAGRSIRKTRKAAREIEVDAGTILDSAKSDIVVISVPVEETERVAMKVAPLMKEGSLLLDISSVKTEIADRIASSVSDSIEYVSVHPLFGPDIDQMYGQNIVAVPFREGPRWRKLDRAFREAGVRIYRMTVAQHDRKMAYTQGLHHFALIAFGIALGDEGGEPKTRSLRDTEVRISGLIQNWETVRAIQRMNPFLPDLRRDFGQQSERRTSMTARDLFRTRREICANVQKWSRKQ